MITDEERREVAAKLRERTKKPMHESMQRMFTETLGMYTHNICWMNPDKATARWDVIVNYLADLIDRPRCRLELTAVETHGNTEVKIYECSECGRTCEEIYGKYERCPHCGAVVIDGTAH